MSKKPNIAVLILAAGASERMRERIKQLLPWKNTTLLENAITNANESKADAVYVVLGAHINDIKKQILIADNSCIYNKSWSTGMASSIVIGLKHLLTLSTKFDSIVLMVADQPLIDTTYLNMIIDTWGKENASITATAYKNGGGVPAMFNKVHFTELLKLTKDYGARNIINKNAHIILNPQGKEMDIDTWQDYQKMIKKL